MFTYEIEQDCDPFNPRVEYDNVATFVTWHRNYDLTDPNAQMTQEQMKEFMKLSRRTHEFVPLYLMDHSGLSMSTGPFLCPWDSGQVGWAYVAKKDIERGFPGCKHWRVKAKKIINAEVETFSQYLSGDVWGYRILEDGEEVESCWGFFGHDYCEQEAAGIVAHQNAQLPVQVEMDFT